MTDVDEVVVDDVVVVLLDVELVLLFVLLAA
jgi:hypothetical protein